MLIEDTIKEMIEENKIYYDEKDKEIKYSSRIIWD